MLDKHDVTIATMSFLLVPILVENVENISHKQVVTSSSSVPLLRVDPRRCDLPHNAQMS